MELFPAADSEQFDFIKREIDSSDYYIVIIAGRYGSVAETGLSFTEMEYDYAVQQGKPVLAFVTQDINKLIGERLERSEELRLKLEEFTCKATKRKLVKFFSNPDDLKSAVLSSLPSQFNLKPMRGWVRAGQSSRGDLEEITNLQREVLRLREENERLKTFHSLTEVTLAHGSDPVAWELGLDDFELAKKWPAVRRMSLRTTWDKLLIQMFLTGSSQIYESEARQHIALLVLEQYPGEDDAWVSEMRGFLKASRNGPTFSSVETIIRDVRRQFNGLDLMQESKETTYYTPPFGGPQQTRTEDIWRLTLKGQQRLALAQGYRRDPHEVVL